MGGEGNDSQAIAWQKHPHPPSSVAHLERTTSSKLQRQGQPKAGARLHPCSIRQECPRSTQQPVGTQHAGLKHHQLGSGWHQCLREWGHHVPKAGIPQPQQPRGRSRANVKEQPWLSAPRSLGGQSWHGAISRHRRPRVAAEGELFDLHLLCLYYLSRVNKCR